MDPENSDFENFKKSIYRQRLQYFWLLKKSGYKFDPLQLEEAEIDVYPDLVGTDLESRSLNQRDIDELQFLLWFEDPQKPKPLQKLKATLIRLSHTRLSMRKEQKHGRPHFHIEYKNQYKASYAVDTLEKLAGQMPREFEKPILEWASKNQKVLKVTWDHLQAGENVQGAVWESPGQNQE